MYRVAIGAVGVAVMTGLQGCDEMKEWFEHDESEPGSISLSSFGDSAPKKKPPTKDKSQQTSEGVRNGVEQGQQTDEDGQPATPPADGNAEIQPHDPADRSVSDSSAHRSGNEGSGSRRSRTDPASPTNSLTPDPVPEVNFWYETTKRQEAGFNKEMWSFVDSINNCLGRRELTSTTIPAKLIEEMVGYKQTMAQTMDMRIGRSDDEQNEQVLAGLITDSEIQYTFSDENHFAETELANDHITFDLFQSMMHLFSVTDAEQTANFGAMLTTTAVPDVDYESVWQSLNNNNKLMCTVVPNHEEGWVVLRSEGDKMYKISNGVIAEIEKGDVLSMFAFNNAAKIAYGKDDWSLDAETPLPAFAVNEQAWIQNIDADVKPHDHVFAWLEYMQDGDEWDVVGADGAKLLRNTDFTTDKTGREEEVSDVDSDFSHFSSRASDSSDGIGI